MLGFLDHRASLASGLKRILCCKKTQADVAGLQGIHQSAFISPAKAVKSTLFL